MPEVHDKRRILAPFGVGTVDQALMAVIPSVRHSFVRAFGLAGKVVILDEVHSYDMYTGTLLNELIKILRAMHCTVIILSATLKRDRRYELLQYSGQTESEQEPYPLISIAPKDGTFYKKSIISGVDCQVALKFYSTDSLVIDEALHRAEQGQQVLWIENVVDEAQKFYSLLAPRAKEINVACGLLHSRFSKRDRQSHEQTWVSLFGKEKLQERSKQGRILVGTQILEQSLDIDADFLVSRICPTDMLLQRLGRLWRHSNVTRPSSALREAWILTPSLSDVQKNPKEALGKTGSVYDRYILYRSLKVLEGRHSIVLPSEIRSLIESTYVDQNESEGTILALKAELEKKREELQSMARLSSSPMIKGKISTRYSEQDSVDVLLLKAYYEDKSGTWVELLPPNGEEKGEKIYLPRIAKSQDRKKWRKSSIELMQHIVRVVDYLAPPKIPRKNILWLEEYLYIGSPEYEESPLRVVKVEPSGEIRSLTGALMSTDYYLTYNQELGYQAEKRESN